MSLGISDASTAQAHIAKQQMDALSREAETARRAINAGAPVDKEAKLRKACEGFEAVFVQKMWETMRASLPEDGLISGSKEEKFWQGMYDQELGKNIAGSGGIGLADMMMEQLSRNLHNASDVAANATLRKPLNIEPAPLMPPLAEKTAPKGDADSMYDTPAALQGEYVEGTGKDVNTQGIQAPPIVQAALDDLAARMNRQITITTETFIGGSGDANRRPISKQVRVIQAPDNAPAHGFGNAPTQIGINTARASGNTSVGASQIRANTTTQSEPVPIAPYAAETLMAQMAQEKPVVQTLASSIQAIQDMQVNLRTPNTIPSGMPSMLSSSANESFSTMSGQQMPTQVTSQNNAGNVPNAGNVTSGQGIAFYGNRSSSSAIMTPSLPLTIPSTQVPVSRPSSINKV